MLYERSNNNLNLLFNTAKRYIKTYIKKADMSTGYTWPSRSNLHF